MPHSNNTTNRTDIGDGDGVIWYHRSRDHM